jgi:hypothetical protein
MAVCKVRNKAQANVLAVNDLDMDKELPDEILNALATEDELNEQFCQLSLNAITTKDNLACLKFKAKVKDKVMLVLLDSGSSHSFVSKQFADMTDLPVSPTQPKRVKLANGNTITTNSMAANMKWYCQGHTMTSNMIVLDMQPYDAILGYDWLEAHPHMTFDWDQKTMTFIEDGKSITLKGLHTPIREVNTISATKAHKMAKGNEVWAFVLVEQHHHMDKTATVPEQIQHLLLQYKDIFQTPTMLPPHRTHDHAIPLYPGSVPVNSKPYHYSPHHKTEIEQQVQELLQSGFITHSKSPFASPVLLVKKKDGTWRLCLDYRKLNALTIKNRFPMPIIEEILDELAGTKYFTKLDMKSGYHQVRMDPADEYKTAFKTHQGHYQYKVMPFGLTNAPATFQCLMNHILQPYLRKCVLVFLDGILIYSPTLDDHLVHLQEVFELLRQNQLYLKESKCSFAQQSISYLGHIIWVSTDPRKIQDMQNWPVPTSVTELRGFLGLTGYYRRFIKGYGLLTQPLNTLLSKKAF